MDLIVALAACVGLAANLWFVLDRAVAPRLAAWVLGGLALTLFVALCARSFRLRVPGVRILDQRLGGGHLARSWEEARVASAETPEQQGVAEWLARDLRERIREESDDPNRAPPSKLAFESRGLVALLLLALLLWLSPWFGSGAEGMIAVEDQTAAQDGSGTGQAGGGSGPGDAAGAQDRLTDSGDDQRPGETPEGQGPDDVPPDPQSQTQPDPSTPEQPDPPEESGPPDSPSGSGRGDGSTPGLGGPEDPVELPVADTFVLPEFVGEGEGQRTTAPVAGLDENPAGTSPAERPETSSSNGTENQPPALDPIEFSRAEEWPLRARHVPRLERPSVRRWFELLQEVFR